MKNSLKCQKIMIIQQELYLYHQRYHKLIGIDLSRQTNTSIAQQINFIRKLEEDDGGTMFFIVEKRQQTILNFLLDSLLVTE